MIACGRQSYHATVDVNLICGWSGAGLGDNTDGIGWWDDTIDGHAFVKLQGSPRMVEGSLLTLALDTTSGRLTFSLNDVRVGAVRVPLKGPWVPAVYVRTHLDRISIVD